MPADTVLDAERWLALAGGELDLRTGVLVTPTGEVRLTSLERDLAAYLGARPGDVVGRDELLAKVWGYAPGLRTRAVDDAVKRLRAKTEAGGHPRQFVSVRGKGLRFQPLAADVTAPTSQHGPPEQPKRRERRVQLSDRVVGLDSGVVVFPCGRKDSLPSAGLALLRLLAQAEGAWVSRVELTRRFGPGRAFDNALYKLRRKLEVDPAQPRHLERDRRRGVRLVQAQTTREEVLPERRREIREARAHLASHGAVQVVGGPGMGVEAVVERLAWVDGEVARVVRLDGPRCVERQAGERLVVTAPVRVPLAGVPVVRVSPLSSELAVDFLRRRIRELGTQVADDELLALTAAVGGRPLALELAAWLVGTVRLSRIDAPKVLDAQRSGEGAPPLRRALDAAWVALDPADQQALGVFATTPPGMECPPPPGAALERGLVHGSPGAFELDPVARTFVLASMCPTRRAARVTELEERAREGLVDLVEAEWTIRWHGAAQVPWHVVRFAVLSPVGSHDNTAVIDTALTVATGAARAALLTCRAALRRDLGELGASLTDADAACDMPLPDTALAERVDALITRAWSRMAAGENTRARADVDAVTRIARAQGEIRLEARALGIRGTLERVLGRWDEAAGHNGHALALMAGRPDPLVPRIRANLAHAHIHAGRIEAARAQLSAGRAHPPPDARNAGFLGWGEARLLWLEGRPGWASRGLARTAELFDEHDLVGFGATVRIDQTWVALVAGELEEAQALAATAIATLTPSAPTCLARALLASAVVDHCHGRVFEAQALADRAGQILSTAPPPEMVLETMVRSWLAGDEAKAPAGASFEVRLAEEALQALGPVVPRT